LPILPDNITLGTYVCKRSRPVNDSPPTIRKNSTSGDAPPEEHFRTEKPLACSICHKSYARKAHLSVHYRVHSGERPYVCTDCGKDFTEKRFLKDHALTAHNGREGPLQVLIFCTSHLANFRFKFWTKFTQKINM
jgi:uncharacterized Zn-finger protein